MNERNFSDYVNHIVLIRRNINCLTYREQDGTAIFVLVYRLSSTAYISLRSPSSMVLLHVDNQYPTVIGYADNREQFAIAVHEHLTN